MIALLVQLFECLLIFTCVRRKFKIHFDTSMINEPRMIVSIKNAHKPSRSDPRPRTRDVTIFSSVWCNAVDDVMIQTCAHVSQVWNNDPSAPNIMAWLKRIETKWSEFVWRCVYASYVRPMRWPLRETQDANAKCTRTPWIHDVLQPFHMFSSCTNGNVIIWMKQYTYADDAVCGDSIESVRCFALVRSFHSYTYTLQARRIDRDTCALSHTCSLTQTHAHTT